MPYVKVTSHWPAGDSLQEVTVQDESRGMWLIYLDQQDYKSAFRHCKSQVRPDCLYHCITRLARYIAAKLTINLDCVRRPNLSTQVCVEQPFFSCCGHKVS